MSRLFYTDKELADILGVSVSLVRKIEKDGPSRKGRNTLDIRLIAHVTVGNMRRWNAEQTNKVLGLAQTATAQTEGTGNGTGRNQGGRGRAAVRRFGR